jgi:hypothetical protein
MILYDFMNWFKFECNFNKILNGSGLQISITTTKAVIIALLILVLYSSGLDAAYSTTSQEKGDDNGLRATTSCMGVGSISESEADAQLLSGGNNITQQCEQIISSADGNDSRSKNYATNEVTGDGETTKGSSNQINQQSKQKIND